MEKEKVRMLTIGRGGSTKYFDISPDETCSYCTQGYIMSPEDPDVREIIAAGGLVVFTAAMRHDCLVDWAFSYPMPSMKTLRDLPPEYHGLTYLPDDAFAYLAQKMGAKVYNMPELSAYRIREINDWHKKFLGEKKRRKEEREANREKEEKEREERERHLSEPCCNREDAPTWGEVMEMCREGIAEALDGCQVEPDGKCCHGSVAWPRFVGVV